jgi:glycosyltransferase involved in cell wall biosynthesis
MNIGIVHPKFGAVGGAELLIAKYGAHLRSIGHTVRIVTTDLDAARWPLLQSDMDPRVVREAWIDAILRPGRYAKQRRRAERMAAELRGMDAVLAGNYPGNVAAANAIDVGRRMWVCMEPARRLYPRETFPTLAAHVDATRGGGDTALLARARRMFARHAAPSRGVAAERRMDLEAVTRLSGVVAISEFTAENVQRIYGRTADAIVYPTVPIAECVRRTPGMDADGLRVLVHSRLEWSKNVEMVLLAFAAFRARHPGAHELHVVGTGRELGRLRETARARGIEPAVRFHGFLDTRALEALYARCEMMALLPVDEPFGMVYPEAAMRGLLLAGPDHGGPLEILDGGALGWALNIFSPEPLADAFAEAWRLPIAEVERRRERTAAACRGRFGPEATLGRLAAQITG